MFLLKKRYARKVDIYFYLFRSQRHFVQPGH